MACEALEEIINECLRNSGGMKQILVGDQEDLGEATVVDGEITALTSSSTPVQLNVKRKTSNYIEDQQEDFVQGSTVVTQTIVATIHRRSAVKSNAINIMSAGQRYLFVLVQDMNDVWWLFEYAQLQSVGEGSGQERADGSKYMLTFIAESDQLAYSVQESVVDSIIAVS